MARKIAIEMNSDADYEITERVLKKFRRALYEEDGGGFQDGFYQALDDWREEVGIELNGAVDHDDPRLSITLPAAEYKQWCREVATAWRKRLGESNEVLDIAEAVNQGINKALTFIGLKVEQQPEPKKADVDKPAAPRGRFAAAVALKASSPKSARKAKPARKAAAKVPALALNGKGHVNGLANGAAPHA